MGFLEEIVIAIEFFKIAFLFFLCLSRKQRRGEKINIYRAMQLAFVSRLYYQIIFCFIWASFTLSHLLKTAPNVEEHGSSHCLSRKP